MITRIVRKMFGSPSAPPGEWGRNEPCWCGSGKKYKVCHQLEDDRERSAARAAACRGAT
jgi:uncharacterized protein YecA (UPF0149 family)